ncbi:hypothetical protein Q9L58_003948 [Maublancomyces gigas]|uniref:Dihydrofolate reductase n=1 Tax=Discina gigas TaxID=1032678 RepID=A0ABR3GMH9_9PEZI
MSSPLTIIVAATTQTLGIGKSGALPWRLKKEMAYFARVTKRIIPTSEVSTTKNAVIMGRKTWESIPSRFRPLPERINVVVSRGEGTGVGAIWAKSLDDALKALDKDAGVGKIFIIGGAQLYEAAMAHPRTRNILLTSVHKEFEVDTFFPVDMKDGASGWAKKSHEELGIFVGEDVPAEQDEGGVKYDFELYQKV